MLGLSDVIAISFGQETAIVRTEESSLAVLLDSLDADPVRKGAQFEQICQWFLLNDPVYQAQVKRVWHWSRWPGRWGADV